MGNKRKIPNPEKLFELFLEFKDWKQSQKITTQAVTKVGVVELKHAPPLTWQAFDAWLFNQGIAESSEDYRYNKNGQYSDFSGIVRVIGNIMFAQKFEGAAVGAYNSSIIARELKLAEPVEVKGEIKKPDWLSGSLEVD